MATFRRIVAVLFRRVGDSLLATPALRAIKRQYPDTTLVVIAEPQVRRVFDGNPYIDQTIILEISPSVFRLARAIRSAGRCDCVMDFLSDPRSAVSCLLSGSPTRVGFAYPLRKLLYSHPIERQTIHNPIYSARHKLKLAAALNCAGNDESMDFRLKDTDLEFADTMWNQRGWDPSTSAVAFFIHSRRAYKRWPITNFARVIQALDNLKIIPLILATPGDDAAIVELTRVYSLPDASLMRINDLGHLGSVLKKCRLLIGNDGGPKHLAVALGVPTLTIFGNESPLYWTPPRNPLHAALSSERDSISAPNAINWISAEAVASAATDMLGCSAAHA